MIDYQLIKRYHGVDGILNSSETDRRLREVSSCYYAHDKRCKALIAVVGKKSGMSETELRVLNEFPEQGVFIGNYSNALIFAPELCRKPMAEHKAIVSLIKQGCLAIVEGYNAEMKQVQIIVKV